MNNIKDLDYYLVTDSDLSRNGIFSDVENAIRAGCKIVQYREKEKSTEIMIKEAKKIKNICEKKAIFLINDRVDVAYSSNADGVHIGQEDIPIVNARDILGYDKIFGKTVHNIDEAIKAEKQGADYVGVAPIFQTDTKNDTKSPCGIDMVYKIRKAIKIPIVAVGGINKENVCEVIKAGADSIVSISSVLCNEDVYSEIYDFINIIRGCKQK